VIAELLPWLLFLAFVGAVLAIDLGVLHRDAHAVGRREALAWTAVWVGLAVAFNLGVYLFRGSQAGLEWTTGYLIEESLSVDNVFVFLLLFATFAVPAQLQHRVLFWGIVGAIVMRAGLILVGSALVAAFGWIFYVFGAFLVFTGVRFLRDDDPAPVVDENRVIRLAKRLFPMTPNYEGQRFFVRRGGTLFMTPLFVVLLLIESTDLVFAVDSIPAIFAVTDDPFTIFTSNIFAILGLRSMYFVLSGYLSGLTYLKPALAAVLIFVGAKMLLADLYHVPALVSLGAIVAILGVAIVASLRRRPAHAQRSVPAPPHAAGERRGEAVAGRGMSSD